MGFLASTNNFQNKNIDNTFQATKAQTANSNFAPAIAAAQPTQAAGVAQEQAGVGAAQGVGAQQLSFAQQLQQQAAGGGGPSTAETQLKTATAANNAAAAGAAASAKGLNPAMAARLAAGTAATANQGAAGQAALTREQEQLNAQQQEGAALSGASTTALGTAGAGTGLTNAGTSALGTAAGAQNTQNANEIQNTLGTSAQNETAALANQQADLGVQGANFQESRDNQQASNSMLGSVLSAAGGAAAMFSKGGVVPPRSFAAQLAHHLTHGADSPLPPMHMAHGGHVGFEALEGELAGKGIRNPGALAASIGRKKYGAHNFQAHAEAGKPLTQKLAEGGQVSPQGVDLTGPEPVAMGGKYDDRVYEGGTVDEKGTIHGGKLVQGTEQPGDRAANKKPFAQHLADGGSVASVPISVAVPSMAQPQYTTLAGVPAISIKAPPKKADLPRDTNGVPIGDAALSVAGTEAPDMRSTAGGPAGLASLVPAQLPPAPGSMPIAYAVGGDVPGKANYAGDSSKNDTVPTMLSPGEVVLPRSVSHDPKKAKRFVEHIMSQEPQEYSDVRRRLSQRRA